MSVHVCMSGLVGKNRTGTVDLKSPNACKIKAFINTED